MATTYVYSLRGKVTHETREGNPRCGAVLTGPFLVTTTAPDGRPECPRCFPQGQAARDREAARMRFTASARAERDAKVVTLLVQGATDKAVGRAMDWANRTWVRNINDAMHRAGGKTRFHWGYLVGLAHRDD